MFNTGDQSYHVPDTDWESLRLQNDKEPKLQRHLQMKSWVDSSLSRMNTGESGDPLPDLSTFQYILCVPKSNTWPKE